MRGGSRKVCMGGLGWEMHTGRGRKGGEKMTEQGRNESGSERGWGNERDL